MPHDVIMPALGMAQESGQIVAWLKKPGDKVSEGDPIMEVETDKATMEVEAQVSGYLTEVRAGEGEDVPVGQVVAIIGETADAVSEAPKADAQPAQAEAPVDAGAAAEDLPQGHEVIMPALGMAQDSGIIVGWHKDAGDTVSEGDVLMEVETDKATMEVEAAHSGVLAAILAEDGDDVPVGQVIAIISASAPDKPIRRSMAAAPAAAPAAGGTADAAPAAEAESTQDAAEAPARADRKAAAPSADGRILASPKARRLAAEQGLDLAALAAAGHPQPYHVADLEVLKSLPKAAPAAATGAAPAAVLAEVTAEVPAAGHDAFSAWLAAEHDPAPGGPRLMAAFAAGALRGATGADGVLTVAAGALTAPTAWADPDRVPLSADLPATEDAPALVVRDLTATALTGVGGGGGGVPTLTVTRRGDTLSLHLSHDPAALPVEAAAILLDGMAGRLADPLRHLL